jgi:glyoxylase-like metal-dependent hydrolase (beta-lactamase superfamily II)
MKVGDIDVHPIADGTFRTTPSYFGEHVTVQGHEDFFDRHGQAWLPIGCFLVRTGSHVVLVDTGLGPDLHDDGPRRLLVGGQLLTGLRAAGVSVDEIDVVICTHLHLDHCGWLFDLGGRPVFPRADIWFGAADWERFVLDPQSRMLDHIRHGLRSTDGARLHLVGEETAVVPGIDLLMTPGHTPGHLSVVVSSGPQRALLLGDAITCPLQLDETSWHAMGDVDPRLAAQVRERLFRELEDESTYGAGAHFPELQFGRVLTGRMRRWLST